MLHSKVHAERDDWPLKTAPPELNCSTPPLLATVVLFMVYNHSTWRYAVRRMPFIYSFYLRPRCSWMQSLYPNISQPYGFKCACVVDVLVLRKSSSWVKQEASLLIWASQLISLVLIYRRRLVSSHRLFSLHPLWMVQVTKGLPHTQSRCDHCAPRHREVSALISF